MLENSVTCEDGISVIGKCDDCGEIVYESVAYEHYTTEEIHEIVTSHGTIRLYHYSCPCGYTAEFSYNSGCLEYKDSETIGDDEYGLGHTRETYGCSKEESCGYSMTIDSYYEYISDGSFDVRWTNLYKFYDAEGEVIAEYTSFDYGEWHSDGLKQYELTGESCEDGVTVYNVCARCGEISFDYMTYGHVFSGDAENSFTVETPEGVNEYGLQVCVCGQVQYLYENIAGCCSFSSEGSVTDDETGHTVEKFVCVNSDGFAYTTETYTETAEDGTVNEYIIYRYFMNDVQQGGDIIVCNRESASDA